MRLLVDATVLLLRSAGVKSYTYHWINAMRAQEGLNRLATFPFIDPVSRLDHERSSLASAATYARIALVHAINHGMGPLLDLACRGFDIFHASNQIRVAPRRARLTATVHDLTCWLTPELHTTANIRADHTFARMILQRADGLIAVSESSRQDAIRVLGIQPEKIQVIYPGIAESFFTTTAADVQRVRTLLGLDRSYVLALGTIEPRKNLDRLLDAYLGLAGDIRHEYQLVVCGPRGWQNTTTLARLRACGTDVRYLGYVAEEHLPGLLAGSGVFVYPSLYEGFGFPLAEAMASGVACVTSNVSSLPEVVGDAALTVDPRSVDQLGNALRRLLTSPSLRMELAEAAHARAGRFRWHRAARESLEFFERVAGQFGR